MRTLFVQDGQYLRNSKAKITGPQPQVKNRVRNGPSPSLNTETSEDEVRSYQLHVSFCSHLAVNVIRA